MEFTSEQIEDAQEFAAFYFDLIENHRELFSYHISEEAVLDWFGRTVKGARNIKEFFRSLEYVVKHKFDKIEPCHEIGYRKTHIIKYSASHAAVAPTGVTPVKSNEQEEKTPPKPIIASCSRKREAGQGDKQLNCPTESPAKRARLTDDVIDETKTSTPFCVANISSKGHLQFRAESEKKYQKETMWERPCTFQVAYSKAHKGYLIHLIIYQNEMRCRRNLLNDFNKVQSAD